MGDALLYFILIVVRVGGVVLCWVGLCWFAV